MRRGGGRDGGVCDRTKKTEKRKARQQWLERRRWDRDREGGGGIRGQDDGLIPRSFPHTADGGPKKFG